MRLVKKIEYSINCLKQCLIEGNFYSFRRTVMWPEGKYKCGMLARLQKLYNCKYFVETGTYAGKTPAKLSKYFTHIWTIELDEKLFSIAKEKLTRYSNITCLHGNSQSILPNVVEKLDDNCLFWLDAHYSGSNTAIGEIAAPVIPELEAIALSKNNTHIIAIDDVSDFSTVENNVSLSNILQKIESINPNYKFYFDYDILFALPYEREKREFWKRVAYPITVR